MSEFKNDGDPWTPVDTSATTLGEVKPKERKEARSGKVTARVNLGDDKPAEDEKDPTPTTSEGTEEEGSSEPAKEQTLAEKLAALDAAKKSGGKK